MKPFFAMLLIFICSTAGNSELFLLPDEASDALHQIKQEISSAKKSVVIITPDLQSRALSSSIIKLLDTQVTITIITTPDAPGESARLAQYSGVTVLTHRGIRSEEYEGVLGFSILLVDERRLCIGTAAFNEKAMKHNVATLECSRDTERIAAYSGYLKTIAKRAKPYLK